MNATVTAQEEQRYTELQEIALNAALTGEIEILRSMIQSGLPVDLKDNKGNTLLISLLFIVERILKIQKTV